VRRDDAELEAKFVGPLLSELGVTGAVVVGHEQNPLAGILLADLFECLDGRLLTNHSLCVITLFLGST